ncbi:MAG TPA: DUF2298 domain-containing protein [bacterium]|nr:DUF2298 domain-containing protein [bacterium]
MSHDILLFFQWWFSLLVIGLVAWPLARRFFRSFEDTGYMLSKGLGLILVAFINWILSSLHILPFSMVSVIISIGLLGAASWWFKPCPFSEFATFLKTRRKMILVVEGVFFTAFLAFTLVRMANPDIAQTEKMPDYAFLNGIVQSDYFPPRDPWFAGGTINYFYYGHYIVGLVTQLTGVPPEYGYNLGIAMIFALTLITAAGISFNLIRRLWYGITGGLLVAFIGNLDCAVQLMSNLGDIASGDKKFFPFTWFNWWMSSRVIVREGVDVTINEFPFWSYILGDLHAHMNVVPISLLVLAIILELFRSAGDGLENLGPGRDKWFRLGITAIVLGAIPCANTWDMPTYFALTVAALLLGRQFAIASRDPLAGIRTDSVSVIQIITSPLIELKQRVFQRQNRMWRGMLWSWAAIVMVIAGTRILYLPFFLNFHPAGVQGIRWVNAEQRTLAGDFLTIYGFFFYILVPFAAALIVPRLTRMNERLKPLVGVAALVLFFFFMVAFGRFMVAFCLMSLFVVLAVPINPSEPDSRDRFFVLALFIMVLLILLGCEFIYIKDAYGKSLERQNTIFKFYYQAWIFCGISAAYALYWIREKAHRTFAGIWEPGFRILFLAVLMFPFVGSAVKTGNFRAFSSPSQFSKATLDGMFYMTWQHKGDYGAIHWLRKNAGTSERVLEAVGPAFSHYGRISAGTGMSTVLGWANHENIWREGDWKTVGARKNEVKTAYTSGDPSSIRNVLDMYDVNYVYYGKLEREQYPSSSPDHFSFMEKVYEIRDSDQKMSYLFRYRSAAGQ